MEVIFNLQQGKQGFSKSLGTLLFYSIFRNGVVPVVLKTGGNKWGVSDYVSYILNPLPLKSITDIHTQVTSLGTLERRTRQGFNTNTPLTYLVLSYSLPKTKINQPKHLNTSIN